MKNNLSPTLPALVTPTPWDTLKNFTDARIALGRAGVSLPTSAHLAFQLAHAQARDAVHLPFDAHGIQTSLQALGLPTLRLHSQALERTMYLQRLQADTAHTWTVAPLTVVTQGRVAIGDQVGAALRANTVVALIGERPGLSSPDSMGLYLTWEPKVGTTDAARNCISNVRPAGLSLDAAAQPLHALLSQARLKQLTGVGLKDEMDHHVQGLTDNSTPAERLATYGIHPLPKRGGVVSHALIDRLRDAEGI
ncbi:ethanolamine ammonia-lyase subunit EutC [Rhodoferax sp.]|uniref:ethanolamine ammonia-lyase subunit EutC n=1 Tax=Rhodoferax sp. TaxID=50421 RepID=UPI0019EBB2AE|nr:ethanolamine ammonia-lyase light chain EutC [Rhodoferax sp.]MBE0475376.1 ethanolamine ammonia-lyase light chain EutC [Rhodoferax sp.]